MYEGTCVDCGASFVGQRRTRQRCDTCRTRRKKRNANRRCRNWYARHPNYEKDRRRVRHLRDHGLTPEQYDQRLASQGGRCAVCRSTNPGGRGVFYIDHDHHCCSGVFSCGRCVRGLLCIHCNRLLGSAFDNPDTLRSAIDYLGMNSPRMP